MSGYNPRYDPFARTHVEDAYNLWLDEEPIEVEDSRKRSHRQKHLDGGVAVVCVSASDLWPIHWLLS